MPPHDRQPIRFERWPWETAPGLAARFTTALVTVFVLLAPYLANISRDYTRYCYFWRTSDTLCVGLLLLGAAVLATLAGEWIRSTQRPPLVRLFDHLGLAVFGAGVIGSIAFAAPKLPYWHRPLTPLQIQTAWILLALVLGYSFGRPQSRLLPRVRQLCGVTWPVVPVTLASLLLKSTYPAAVEPIVPMPQPCVGRAPGAQPAAGGIYVFLFDEWSYTRTFDRGVVLPKYSQLSAFARTATVYTQARSPGECTEQSLPAILLQTGDPVSVESGRLGFRRPDGVVAPARQYPSIFSAAEPLRYHTALVGSTLPYRLWLGEAVDVCRSYCPYPRGSDLAGGLGVHAFNGLHYLSDPWTARAYKNLEARVTHAVTCNMLGNARHDVQTIIREWPANTFLFAHVFLPHLPAVLKSDLTFRRVDETGWSDGNLVHYEANLAAMDALLGDWLAALKQAGKYDDALIVLTSDHDWRCDPDRPSGQTTGPRNHVPLVVRAPRQTEPGRVDELFETKDLGRLIADMRRPSPSPGVLLTENRTDE